MSAAERAMDPSRKWPMIVRLHGYQPGNPSYHRWPGALKRQDQVAERYGVIVLEPHARGSSWYGDIGETDVLRAIFLAKQAVCVGEDRIYLKGGSMGGGGAWRIASHHPGMFAAVSTSGTGVESDGGMDPEQFEGIAPRSGRGPAEWGFFEEAESLRTTPVFVNHGDVDFLAPAAKALSGRADRRSDRDPVRDRRRDDFRRSGDGADVPAQGRCLPAGMAGAHFFRRMRR